MRQPLSDYEERYDGPGDRDGDGFGLAADTYPEAPPPRDRRLPMLLLAVLAMTLFAGGLYVAYVQGTRHSATVVRSDGVPLLRADEHPIKVRPEQPGGMPIPNQNVSLYNEKTGGPAVEKLLPAPEQPMPRPQPAPPEPPPAPAAAVNEPNSAVAAIPAPAGPAPATQADKPNPAPPKHASASEAGTSPAGGKAGIVRLRLGSLRSPEGAREEWARLKHENADLLGQLTAVAVKTDLGDKGIYYRIEAGSFTDAGVAERLCSELKHRNLGCILAR